MNKIIVLALLVTSFSCSPEKTNTLNSNQINQPYNKYISEDIIPTPTPSVYPTAKPTPLPIIIKSFKIVVAVIKNSGDITPVARTEFTVLPYNRTELLQTLISRNKPPHEPSIFDEKYGGVIKVSESTSQIYFDDLRNWEKIAYIGIDEEIKKQSNGFSEGFFKTDLSGEAIVNFPLGTWFISGTWKNSVSKVYWNNVKIEVTPNLEKFELSNDNANIF